MQPSNFALPIVDVRCDWAGGDGSPVGNDTVIEQHTIDDLGHLANNAVRADDGFFDARALVHARALPHDRVRGDLRLLVNECAVLRVGG